jgi:ACS family tartrate transporter-like MFS transporter
MILYLTYWFPASERAKAVAQFMTGTAIANVIGGPLSGLLLTLDGTMGLAGWQWLFLVEGIPAILLGFFVLYHLTEGPAEAHWLTADERKWLIARMEADRAASVSGHDSSSLKAALLSPRVWYFGLLYFTIVVGFYGITFWLPQILKNLSGSSDVTIGLISAIPYVIAAVVMVVVAASSDRAGERRWHVAIPSFISAAGLILSASTRDPVLSLAALSLAAAGIWGALGPFWSLPTAFLTGAAAAGGIALINSLGNLGGFLSPILIGEIRARTGSFAMALFVLAAAPFLTGVLVLMGVRGGGARQAAVREPVRDLS